MSQPPIVPPSDAGDAAMAAILDAEVRALERVQGTPEEAAAARAVAGTRAVRAAREQQRRGAP